MLLYVHLNPAHVPPSFVTHLQGARHRAIRTPTYIPVSGSQSHTRNPAIDLNSQISTFLQNATGEFLPERHGFVEGVQWLGACCVLADDERQYDL